MQKKNISYYYNDLQYPDNAKDGISVNEKCLIVFLKDIIREYGERVGHHIFLSIHELPIMIQQECLKQFLFFEGSIDFYEEISNDPFMIDVHLHAEKDNLLHWMNYCIQEIEQEEFCNFIAENNLAVNHYDDNGEPFLVRR